MTGVLIILGLTGSLLAFYPELQRALNPYWYPDREPATWLPAGVHCSFSGASGASGVGVVAR